MIVILNGPLGVGKSTLAEALSESIAGCVMLDGDHLVAANPPAADEVGHLHSTISVMVEHHRRFGYRHFVINHLWTDATALGDLRQRLVGGDPDIRVFLLTLPERENLARIARRAGARALDETEFERRTVAAERAALSQVAGGELGEPFDVSAPVGELVVTLRAMLGMG